jgi:hypothetical protein
VLRLTEYCSYSNIPTFFSPVKTVKNYSMLGAKPGQLSQKGQPDCVFSDVTSYFIYIVYMYTYIVQVFLEHSDTPCYYTDKVLCDFKQTEKRR